MDKMTEEQVMKFFDALVTGDLHDGLKLTPRQAFDIIWMLDEMEALSDRYELCEHCKGLHLYDDGCFADADAIESDYHFRPEVIKEGGFYCDTCAHQFELPYDERPDVDKRCPECHKPLYLHVSPANQRSGITDFYICRNCDVAYDIRELYPQQFDS